MNAYVISADHADIISELSDEQAGMVLKALFAEDPVIDDVAARIVYKTIFAQIARYNNKYEKRSEAGKKGMQKRWSDNKEVSNDNKAITNDIKSIVTDNNGITNNNSEYQTITPIPIPNPIPIPKDNIVRFTPPTLDQVQEYINECGYSVDASRFIDYYSSKGWMVGKNKMKDWKAALRNWARPKKNNFTMMPQRDFDWDEFGRAMDGC